jgi:TRAP-type C4-dicarboxylate transport system substrate-binding protein
MKKRHLLRLLGSLFLVLTMVASTSMTVQAQQPIKLRFYYHASPTGGQAYFLQDWIKKVKEATQGRLDIAFYPGATLGKPTEAYEMVKSGVVELAVVIIGFFPGQFPLSDVVQLPFIDLHNATVASRVYWGLYDKFPQFRAEYPGVKVLALYCDTPTPIGANKQIRTMEDMKGLKVRALAGSPTELLKTLGGTPVLMPPGDIYTSMERKVLDGWMISWEACVGHKLFEVTDYYTAANTYQPALALLMNPAAWNKLPPDIQNVMEKYIGAAGSEFCGKEFDRYNQMDKAKVQAMKGKTIIDLSPAETKRWKESCNPIWDRWVANIEAKGLPGKAALQETLNLSAKFAAELKK